MKKYVFLFVFTVILTSSFVFAGKFFDSLIVEADVSIIDSMSVDEDMICTGKVEFEKSKNIFASSSCVIKEIFFKEGDSVREGDVLLETFKAEEQIVPTASVNNKDTSDISDYSDFRAIYKKFMDSQKSLDKTDSNLNLSGIKTTNEVVKVVSPISGVLTSISSKEGQYVSSSGVIATVSDRSSLQIRMKINEMQISNVAVGQKVIITGVGFKDTVYEGTVKNIAGQACGSQEGIGSDVFVDVIVSIDTSDENIKPGFTAKCKVIFNKDCNVIVVPYRSVKADEDGKEYVYKCKEGKTVKAYVTTGREFDDGFEIKSGIDEGEIIIKEASSIGEGVLVKAKNVVNQE